MNNKFKYSDTKEAKRALEKIMINGIFEYAKNGTFPNNSPNSYMDAYTIVQNMADEGDTDSEVLFKFHNEKITNFVVDCCKEISKAPPAQLIDTFIKYSENISFVVYWMNRIFTYLDRFYTKSKGKKTLCKNALDIYKNNLYITVQGNLYKEVNRLIKDDRNGNVESRHKIKAVLKIVDDLDLFSPKIVKENNKILWVSEKDTEAKNGREFADKWYDDYFKKETETYSINKAKNDINKMSAPEYISSTLKFLEDEKTRETEYINPRYHDKINAINYKHLVEGNAEQLSTMETGIPYMFENKRDEELKKAYQLISNSPGSLKVITEAFDPYIRKRGTELYENKEIMRDPKKFIPVLINLKKEMDNLVANCFGNNANFQDTKNKSFSVFMSKEHYAKQLSNYTDFCMKIGFKGKSEEEIDKELNEIVGLFKCLSNKLAFQIEENKKTSDRLIQGRTLSLNAEKSLISKLKQEAGVTYVTKLTEMMNDLEKNRSETESYNKSKSGGKPNGIAFKIQVISQSAWEISKKNMEKIELPKFLSFCIEDFEKFYIKRHPVHKLVWCLGLSKIDIKYLALPKQYISISTLVQFLTLLFLEKYGKLTLGKIRDLLGCSINTVLNDIPGLVYNPSFNKKGEHDKGIILGTFNGTTKEFKETDEISFNKNFVNNTIKFNTLPLVIKKTAAENKEIEMEEAQITKRYQDNILQATLTRIMKSRIGQKTTHVWLIGEAAKQIEYFKAQPQQIKENIEKLIEKNIIKRGEKDRSCYEYIA